VFYYLEDFFSINMVNTIFKGNKGEDPKVFLREYKKVCIGIKLWIVVDQLINLFLKFTLVWIIDNFFERIMGWHN
jgi:hypothetical protein